MNTTHQALKGPEALTILKQQPDARLELVDYAGQLVACLTHNVDGKVKHVSVDARGARGLADRGEVTELGTDPTHRIFCFHAK